MSVFIGSKGECSRLTQGILKSKQALSTPFNMTLLKTLHFPFKFIKTTLMETCLT